MYFTSLPDHTRPGFDEALHFSRFKKHNIIFNALSSHSHCDEHVGCLSFKTVLSGEEWYGVNNHRLAIRPGRFLILNDDQTYSCNIEKGEKVKTLSVFFKKEFASSVFYDSLHSEEMMLDNPLTSGQSPEFFQTLNDITPELQRQLSALVATLDGEGYSGAVADEYLVFLLHYLVRTWKSEAGRARKVNALKTSTQTEIYKRLCIAKDVLQSSYMDSPGLDALSSITCLSVPQLVRQFKAVFRTTPHQYLIRIRLQRAAELLRHTGKPVHEIAWLCGFENTSAFCRAFKSEYAVQPLGYRKQC
ncbi:helix-turn-helix domain-containing protein [Chitinophaga barathri]|uniref:AraC family transcriptional regulator n=1 Tax=Chitinophaga barathri TaxID=1647451 RepID=A0A3N4MKW1_9BACT|nr:AraC family transcriptional regulator [Chitinophaga barathri]RPD42587.1 AraC family transcriptional regulator [Chitinophaga barathri]